MALLPPPSHHAQKKTGHAAEQDRPDVLRQRQTWFEAQLDLDPERLVFVDETSTSTKMARTHGRCPRGQRLRMALPHGHWKTTTLVVALSVNGVVASMVVDRAINRIWFEAYVEQVLAPALVPGQIVVMDNLGSHKGPRVRELIEAAGAELRFLPPYSPDFSPAEPAISQIKAHLRKAAERTIGGLWDRIGEALNRVTPDHAGNYFEACGYEPA